MREFIKRALIFIVVGLLVTVVSIFCSVYKDFSHVEIEQKCNKDLDNLITDNFTLKMDKMMNLQGIQCEKVSYTKSDIIKLKQYWKLVKDYELFHKDGINKLNNGNSGDVKTLTWYCSDSYICGGLGHRLYGITAFLLLAIASDRVLLLKWDDTSVENTYLYPNKINWKYPNHALNGSFSDMGRFRSSSEKKKPKMMVKPLAGNITHISLLYNHPNRINFLAATINKGKGQIHKFSQADLHLFQVVSFKYLFKFSEEVRSFAYLIRSRLNLQRKRYVALHIRTGEADNLFGKNTYRERFANISDINSAIRCAINQADKHIGPDSKVVVVSDSETVKQELAKKYSRVNILNNTILHVDKAKELSDDGIFGIWQDLIIMAEAHIVIFHQSAFPDISTIMCGLSKERIVDINNC